MTKPLLLLGSNMGHCESNLAKAREAICIEIGGILQQSSLYKTAAWGNENQPDFYNQVICVTTSKSAVDLLLAIQKIEHAMGRIRKETWGPRIIDIDILFYGDQIINLPQLKVPHSGIPDRKFTLIPLVEIAKDFIHPISQKSMQTLLNECTDTLNVVKLH
jgi:2-amino-4-hydroxy-6-hydroxymethyldihydropteridine diphosphokinase